VETTCSIPAVLTGSSRRQRVTAPAQRLWIDQKCLVCVVQWIRKLNGVAQHDGSGARAGPTLRARKLDVLRDWRAPPTRDPSLPPVAVTRSVLSVVQSARNKTQS
jgi:hypothetical protein